MMVYVDTSALIAVLNANDEFHSIAAAIWVGLLDQDACLVTSSFVLVETYALVKNRLGMNAVRTLANSILPLIEINWIDNHLYQQTIMTYLTANRRQLSIVDCSSFVVMHHFNIEKAFTFDDHFREQGFEILKTP